MADNPPPTPQPASTPAPNPGPRPTLPGGATGRLRAPTTQLPAIRKPGAGKIVVMLSSVAKAPPAGTQALPRVVVPPATPAPTVLPLPETTPAPAPIAVAPPPVANPLPPLPPKSVAPAKSLPSPANPQLSTTTYVKLPPKTTAPGWTSLSGKPLVPPAPTIATTQPSAPPQLPPKTGELKKGGAQHIPPIRLNEPVRPETSVEESIFLQRQATPPPETPKSPVAAATPGALTAPATPAIPPAPVGPKAPEGALVSLDLFERAQAVPPVPAPPVSIPEAKGPTSPPLVAPPLMPPQPRRSQTPLTTTPMPSVRPPPLPKPAAKPVETVAPPVSLIEPPILEKASEPVAKTTPPPLAAKPAAEVAAPPVVLPPKPEPVTEKTPPPLAAKPAESGADHLALPLIVSPKLDKPSEPVVEKASPPPLAAKSADAIEAPPAPLHMAPPLREKAPEPIAEKLPPPLAAKPPESVEPPAAPLHVAPPMREQEPEPVAEKMLPPLHPGEQRKIAAPPPLPATPIEAKAPPPEASSPKPTQPPTPKPAKKPGGWFRKAVPVVVSSSSQKIVPAPGVEMKAEAKPALKPAVLPSRSQPLPPLVLPGSDPVVTPPVETPKAVVEAKPAEKLEAKTETPAIAKSEIIVPAVVAAVIADAAATAKAKDDPAAKFVRFPATPAESKTPPAAPEAKAPKSAVPLTRAERAKKRRLWSTIAFWGLIFPASIAALFLASLHFGRDTRVEGQIIPPPGMTLSDEVWIVTDFRSLASGIAEDLAAERTPLLQEIQERQDHVQRAQADVAAREERIRLLQDEISAAKSDIDAVVKQARDATQQVWDVDGAAIDSEYNARQDQLQQAIADRAKSLKLNYAPDETFHSPEVWANAYRLALYEVPAGVDSVKEHAWLGDQMKAWRDFQKSMDDRKEALREKAAQIKLEPAPKINDLNTKIDGLQQRIDATEAEEVPLKTELQQAQADLVTAQSAEAGLDDKYYQQLDALPAEAVTKHIALHPNGRFTWIEDDVFVEGEKEHRYWIFARATRPDGRQYWALHRFEIGQNQTLELSVEPPGFLSTKAILRPNLSPDEQEQ